MKTETLCLGNIGGSKICVRPCVDGKSCGILSHGSRKAKVVVESFYVLENEHKLYNEPKLSASLLTKQQQDLLGTKTFTREQWVDLFNAIELGNLPDWLIVVTSPEPEGVVTTSRMSDGKGLLDLESPKRAAEKTGLFTIFPSLSYDDYDSSEDEEVVDRAMTSEEVTFSIKEFRTRFAKLKQKWTSVFQDIEASHLMVTTDLDKLSTTSAVLATKMGSPPDPATLDFPIASVWQAITQMYIKIQHHLASTMSTVQNHSETVEELSTNVVTLQSLHDTLAQTVSKLHDTVLRHDNRFTKLLPFMRALQQNGNFSTQSSSVANALEQKVHQLEQVLEQLQDKQWQAALSSDSFPSRHHSVSEYSLEAKIRDLEAQMLTLQMRIVGNGVKIGGIVFQCFEDVKTWVSAKFQIKRYGLFVDGVSFLDFFTFVSHTDTEKSMSAYYNSQKSGFSSMYEARLAASTQNLFPMVFGRTNSGGMDDSEYLPALMDPDKWDNGMTGLRYQIGRGMGDVEFQLESTIDTVLRDYPEPRQIAKECLYKSKRFVTDLCSFISDDYHKWLHRGHSKKESWRMTTVCVRRIFEEIHSQRVVARDILDIQDGDFSCAKFLWATWKAHDTMSAYVRHQFYEHPSIAAVLARHLADNHVKPDENLGSKLSNVDKAIKNINARLDSVQSIAERLDKEAKSRDKEGGGASNGKRLKNQKDKDNKDKTSGN